LGGNIILDSATRSPHAAWVKQERIDALNPDPDKFLPLAPDFAVELMSASDDIATTQAKMQEYCDNGVRLGWLIDPQKQRVEIYRHDKVARTPRHNVPCQGQPVEILQSPHALLGEDVLPGFVLDLHNIL